MSSVTQVQGTNDSSILSKCSMIERGYFEDPFVKLMVQKQMRRAPLINRGYYIRMKAMDYILRKFLDFHKENRCQIISLGAGFDTAYFRLKHSRALKNVVFLELDFFEVSRNKASLIQDSPELRLLICNGNAEQANNFCIREDAYVLIDSTDYKLIGVDMTNTNLMEACFLACQLQPDVPTLVFSECVITYVTKKKTMKLLKSVCNMFERCTFLLYEQLLPLDGFGQFMIHHFKKLGSPLRCIDSYPSKSAQILRFLSLGWDSVELVDMAQFYAHFIEQEEKQRVEDLEVFDEYEEWLLKCQHYFLLLATKDDQGPSREYYFLGRYSHRAPDLSDISPPPAPPPSLELRVLNLPETDFIVKAHTLSTVLVKCEGDGNSEWLVRIGGYGQDPLAVGHRRLTSLTGIPLTRNQRGQILPSGPTVHFYPENHEALGATIHSSVCADLEHPRRFWSFGGRVSPTKPSRSLVRLDMGLSGEEGRLQAQVGEVETAGVELLSPRWRHASAICYRNGRQYLVIYGGRSLQGRALSDMFLCDLQSFQWTQIQSPSSGDTPWPGPCMSATLTAVPHFSVSPLSAQTESAESPTDRCCLVLCGGLGEDFLPRETPLWHWCCREPHRWNIMPLNDVALCRFSHTTHFLPGSSSSSSWRIVFVGGVECGSVVSSRSSRRDLDEDGTKLHSVLVLDWLNRVVTRYPITQSASSKEVVMVHNHGSVIDDSGTIWIMGGGGNCFSFGTHLNEHIHTVNLGDHL